jgi:hypothetical protein
MLRCSVVALPLSLKVVSVPKSGGNKSKEISHQRFFVAIERSPIDFGALPESVGCKL